MKISNCGDDKSNACSSKPEKDHCGCGCNKDHKDDGCKKDSCHKEA